jgi:hypothetical protein
MGFLTLEGFRLEIFQHLGERAPKNNKVLDNWINRAYFETASLEEFEALKRCANATIEKDERSVTFPDTFLSTLSLADLTNKNRLLRVDLRNLHLRDSEKKGSPREWARRDSTLYVWPTPSTDVEVELFYIFEPPALAADDDVSLLPASWDQAILLLTLRNAWLSFQEDERATLAYQSAMAYVRVLQSQAELDSGQPAIGLDVARSASDLHTMR